MRARNRYPGRCRLCHGQVAVDEGWRVQGDDGEWTTEHDVCPQPETRKATRGEFELDPQCSLTLYGTRCPLDAVFFPGSSKATSGYCRLHSDEGDRTPTEERRAQLERLNADPDRCNRDLYAGPDWRDALVEARIAERLEWQRGDGEASDAYARRMLETGKRLARGIGKPLPYDPALSVETGEPWTGERVPGEDDDLERFGRDGGE